MAMRRGNPWTLPEVEACVSDYFEMLALELTGRPYSKTDHRNVLKTKLNDRSDGSIERKHQNISAILIECGSPYISGYKPLGNYQAILQETVLRRTREDLALSEVVETVADAPVMAPTVPDFEDVIEEPPEIAEVAAKRPTNAPAIGRRVDWLAREARNLSLGAAGEQFVVEYERRRLIRLGRDLLARRVERVSETKGDGLGYDVLSFEADGRERYIEVKTTAFGKSTPFFISSSEMRLSASRAEQYFLYRLFDFRKKPRMFMLSGSVESRCLVEPVSFQVRFR